MLSRSRSPAILDALIEILAADLHGNLALFPCLVRLDYMHGVVHLAEH